MLKTLIVDDEKLVRKGIINIVDWNKYGMQIIGEAENGRAAMEFLANNQVDVIFTDLSMPGLSGIDFLKTIKISFPNLLIVVITMHRDFDYIQDALRVGIVDYITKVQIEKENIDELMQYLSERLHNAHKYIHRLNSESLSSYDNATIIYNHKGITKCKEKLLENYNFLKLDETLWILYESDNVIFERVLDDETIIIDIDSIKDLTTVELKEKIHTYINTVLFYRFDPLKKRYRINGNDDYDKEIQASSIKEKTNDLFRGLEWVTNGDVYHKSIDEIKSFNLSKDKLSVFCYQLYVQWAAYLQKDFSSYFEEIGAFNWWYEWEKWIGNIRTTIKTKLQLNEEYSNEIMIQKAIVYINEHFRDEIALSEILAIVKMSKSYFSNIFKKVTGFTFVNYLKNLRVEKAKQLLKETSQPIWWVGEQVGYEDERYFRRVFFECTSQTPKQYRHEKQQCF